MLLLKADVLSVGPVGPLVIFRKLALGMDITISTTKHSTETAKAGTSPKPAERPGDWTEIVKKGGKSTNHP